MRFPMRVLGMDLGRTVTLIRLRAGQVVIHSTAPFTPTDVASISKTGQPAWLLEATLFHHTFARAARATFPDLPYLAPEGFAALADVPAESFSRIPESWAGELDVMEVEGVPKLREHVFLHHPSRTLVVADLLFNLSSASAWTRFFFRWVSGIRRYPSMSRLYRSLIRDRQAFTDSSHRMLQWDFDRLIVGHGDVIETRAKAEVARALSVFTEPQKGEKRRNDARCIRRAVNIERN